MHDHGLQVLSASCAQVKKIKEDSRWMTIVQLSTALLLVLLGLGGKIVQEAPPLDPNSSMGHHVLSLLCTVINDQPTGPTDDFLTN